MLTRSLHLASRHILHHSAAPICLGRLALHNSSLRLKKKRSKNELFEGFGDASGDLFSTDASERTLWTAEETVEEEQTYDSDVDKGFDDLMNTIVSRLGRTPRVEKPLRRAALINLIDMAHSKEQLTNIVKLLAMYRETPSLKFVVEETGAADAFIARCIKMDDKDSLLEAMSDRPKFGINLTEPRLLRLLKFLSSSPSIASPVEALETAIRLLPIFANTYPSSSLLPTQRPKVCAAILRLVLKLPPEMHEKAETAIAQLLLQVQLEAADATKAEDNKELIQSVVKEIEEAKASGALNITLRPSTLESLNQKFGTTIALQ